MTTTERYGIALSIWCLCILPSQAQLIFSDSFDYTAGTALAGQWKSQCTGNDAMVVNAGLIYNGYPGSGTGTATNLQNGKEYITTLMFPSLASRVYLGFLMKVQSVGAGGGLTCGTGMDFIINFKIYNASANLNMHTGMIIQASGAGFKFGIQGTAAGTRLTSASYDLNTTYLVVLAVDDLSYDLYVNPPFNGVQGLPDVTYPTGFSPVTVSNIQLGQNGYGDISISGMRMSASYLDIVPNVLAAEPTQAPTGISITNATANGLQVSYSGNGNTNTLAVRSAAVSGQFLPVDGVTYSAGQTVGNSEVVVKPAGCCAFTDAGLQPETKYFYKIFSFYQNGANTNNYLTSSFLQGSQFTLSLAPASSAASLTATTISGTQMLISFPPATTISNADGFVILMRQDGVAPDASSITNAIAPASQSLPSGTSLVHVSSSSATSFSQTDAIPGTTYNYSIIPYNWDLQNPATFNYRTISVTTAVGTTAPPAPTGLSASLFSQNGFTLVWAASQTAIDYVLDVSSDGFVTVLQGYSNIIVTGTSKALSGLQPGTSYQCRVRARNASGESQNSQVLTARTIPPAPINVRATNIDPSGRFTANWAHVPGVDHYELDLSTNGFLGFIPYYQGLVIDGATNSIVISNLAPATLYQFRVRAVNSSGASENSSASALTLPLAPAQIYAVNITTTGFVAAWKRVAGATSYSVDVSRDNFATTLEAYTNLLVTDSAVAITGLTPGSLYVHRVRANNASGSSANSVINAEVTVPSAPTAVGVAQVLPTSFVATWSNTPGIVDHYELDASADNFQSFLPNCNGRVISPSENFAGVSNLVPETYYQFRVRAVNAGGASGNTVFGVYTLPGANLQIANLTYLQTYAGGTQSISAQVLNGAPPAVTLSLHHKKVSEKEFQVQSATMTGNQYVLTIDGSYMDELGMEFFLRAVDGAGRSATTTVSRIYPQFDKMTSPTFLKTKLNGSSSSYQIISIPYELKDNLIQTIFEESLGAYDTRRWRIGHFQNGQVMEFQNGVSKIERGQGYWFNAKTEDLLSIRTGAGEAPRNDSKSPYQLVLSKGWNQIGNPYPFGINWEEVLAANPTVGGVGGLIVFRNGGYEAANFFAPFTGGFVFSENPVTISIPVELRVTSGARTGKLQAVDLGSPEWQVDLQLQQGMLSNSLGGIGMHQEASDGKDEFDVLAPPRFSDHIEVVHNHPDYFYSRFARDIVPSASRHTWKFTVEGGGESEMATLQWPDLSNSSSEAQLYLLDVEGCRLINMREQLSVAFKVRAGGTPFQIFYSADPVAKFEFDVALLGDAYPNPMRTTSNIPYVLPDTSDPGYAELSIYEITGKKVLALSDSQLSSGYHELIWDGTDVNGNPVPAGAYIYRLAVNGKPVSSSRRLLVLK